MNKLRYLLREKGKYKVTFVNGAVAFMEKRRFVSKGRGQRAEVGLLFLFPFTAVDGIEKLAPNMSESELIKAAKKMELVQSYDRDFIDKDLLDELNKAKDAGVRDAVKRGFYKMLLPNEKHSDEFNKWFNSYAAQKSLDCWCTDGMIGFDESTFERAEYVLYLAFAAGMKAAEINLLERDLNENS